MSPITGDDKWFQVCQIILQAAKNALTLPVNRYLITTGQIAWDDCCAGQLAVSFTRTSPTENFPTEQVTMVGLGCTPAYEIGEITVSMTRCVPTSPNGTTPPTTEALTKHAQQNLIDANQVRVGVSTALCQLKSDMVNGYGFDFFVRSQLMMGPEGGCDGSELYLYAQLPAG